MPGDLQGVITIKTLLVLSKNFPQIPKKKKKKRRFVYTFLLKDMLALAVSLSYTKRRVTSSLLQDKTLEV